MYSSSAEQFLFTLDDKFRMISRDDLEKKISNQSGSKLLIIDLRSAEAFNISRITKSINIELKELPEKISELDKDAEIIAVCNGSIQSAYAIYYLYMNGFKTVYNLAGGFSGCINNNFPLIETPDNS
jgi:rhodanese-related sulfurtransferase